MGNPLLFFLTSEGSSTSPLYCEWRHRKQGQWLNVPTKVTVIHTEQSVSQDSVHLSQAITKLGRLFHHKSKHLRKRSTMPVYGCLDVWQTLSLIIYIYLQYLSTSEWETWNQLKVTLSSISRTKISYISRQRPITAVYPHTQWESHAQNVQHAPQFLGVRAKKILAM